MIGTGNERRAYLTSASFAESTWIEGEQTNSLSRSCETAEVIDPFSEWGKYIPGKKSATATISVNLDSRNTSAQHKLLQSFVTGSEVFCYLGQMRYNRPCSGDCFFGVITAISDSNGQGDIARRELTIQATGGLQHYPPYNGGIFVLGVSQLGGSDILW